jgi:zinc protease
MNDLRQKRAPGTNRFSSPRSSGLDSQSAKATALPGPDDILRSTLPNGVTVLARENWSAPSVVVEGYLQVGNLDEPLPLMGLASYTSSMLSRGTQQRTFGQIAELIESVGGSVSFGADRYITSFSAKSLVEDLDLILDVLSDELRHPVFPQEHVEKVRGLRMTAIAERENDTRQMAGMAFRELCYPDHPLGRNLLGTRASISAITRDALVSFYETYYAPEGMTIVVVGAVPAEQAVAKVAAAFAGWERQRPGRSDLPPIPRPRDVKERRVAMPEKTQSDIYLGWPAMRRLDPDFEAARLANTVLGVFGMMGRLGLNVREEQGMAYYVYSQLAANKLPGPWALAAGVNPANVSRAIDSMLVEVRRLRDERVPEAELEDSKRYLTGSLPIQLETNDGVAGILVDLEWYGLGLDYVRRYISMVNALTAEEVQVVARKYLNPDAYVLTVAGPAAKA